MSKEISTFRRSVDQIHPGQIEPIGRHAEKPSDRFLPRPVGAGKLDRC